MDTVSLTLALPDGRTVDLGRAPVTDQQGVAGLTGDVNNHYVKLFGAVLIGGALKGGMSAFQIAATEAAGAGQVTAGLTTLGNQATTKVVQPYINIRPTITMEAGQLCTVLLIKPLHLPAMWQGSATHHHTEVGMTKAERLAAKIARDKETLEKQRLALAQNEAALREETRKVTNKRRYEVGALADEAGLLAWSNAEIATLFARVVTLRAQSADLLATLLAEPVTPAKVRPEMAWPRLRLVSALRTDFGLRRDRVYLSEKPTGDRGELAQGRRAMAHLHFQTNRVPKWWRARRPHGSSILRGNRTTRRLRAAGSATSSMRTGKTSCMNTRAISPRWAEGNPHTYFRAAEQVRAVSPNEHDGVASRSKSGRSRSRTN